MPFKILITGAAGFIGSHLSEFLLSKGCEVIGIDNFDSFYARSIKESNLEGSRSYDRFKFFECDILDGECMANLPHFDLVIHLAAKAGVRPSIKHPQQYIDTNISGTHNVLCLCEKRGVRKMLFASSSSIYGNTKEIPFVEDGAMYQPISPYAFTKRSCEHMNFTYHHLYHIDILNLRFFTVYGPRQRPDLAIHKFTKLITEGKSIPVFGDGNTSRDYTFVSDTIHGIYGALNYLADNEGVYDTVNLGNNTPIELRLLISSLENALGKKARIEHLPMQDGDVSTTFANIEKAQELFGYAPKTKLQDGLNQFVKWFDITKLSRHNSP